MKEAFEGARAPWAYFLPFAEAATSVARPLPLAAEDESSLESANAAGRRKPDVDEDGVGMEWSVERSASASVFDVGAAAVEEEPGGGATGVGGAESFWRVTRDESRGRERGS